MRNDRYQRGYETLHRLAGESGKKVVENIQSFAPDFGKMMIEFGFGDVYSRPAFDLKQRELITLVSLITQGIGERQLLFHFKAALRVGWTIAELIEIIIHCAAYAGFPRAAAALEILQQLSNDLQSSEYDCLDQEN
ncbi:carboxymuconolactone decarboxylase family protein [Anoxybacteroides tepidamans]|uniref:carboxymuconolactone decarboxylase family protein n=1 Tax=Anoxybacteroides tepidamans TaxID=265948 RepID=UPI00048A180A|nr:carboxymuconolactone decarboxylase family protein [Anoxybacillus tepidamans]